MWVRLSGSIFSNKQDYVKLRDAIVTRLKL